MSDLELFADLMETAEAKAKLRLFLLECLETWEQQLFEILKISEANFGPIPTEILRDLDLMKKEL